jgi:membrane-bound lytic murein transglycosylase A
LLLRRIAAVLAAAALALPLAQDAVGRAWVIRRAAVEFPLHPPRPWPLEFPNAQYLPLSWAEVDGWADDDQLAAFKTFRLSCQPIMGERGEPSLPKALGTSLREPCRAARWADVRTAADARKFFEQNFVPLQISKLGETDGFVTGYYEPVLEGSRTPTDVYNVPVYRRPSNLFIRGVKQDGPAPNGGPVYRKIGRRKLVPYYDRAEIEDGAIAGRGLEICYLKNQTDLLFMQIQGSGRIKLADGTTVRVNYDAHNGQPYTPVGRILIERNIIPREEMSMQRIREWMEANPDGAKDLRRANKSYVFFREVKLNDNDEAIGGQGIPLTAQRSIAVDHLLHLYGTPFFITGKLPLDSDKSPTPFHRLMIAQDTGSAITGPARADLYFGAGPDAARVAGRLKNNIRFAILVPKALDPSPGARRVEMPKPRPSALIAKLFPQPPPTPQVAATSATPPQTPTPAPAGQATVVGKAPTTDNARQAQPATADKPANQPAAATSVATEVPLPQARPVLPGDKVRLLRRRPRR